MTIDKQAFEAQARPLAERLIGHAMATGKKYGITDAQVSIAQMEKVSDSVENGQVSGLSSGTILEVAVTIFSGDRSRLFEVNNFDEKKLLDLLDENMQVIQFAPENPHGRLLEPEKVYHGAPVDLDLLDTHPVGHDELIGYAKKMEAAVLAYPGIKTADRTIISSKNACALTLATNGVDETGHSSAYSASLEAIAEDADGKMQADYSGATARHFCDMADPDVLGREAACRAVRKLGAIKPLTGPMPVVLSPDAAEGFFSKILEAFSGSAVYEGTTFLKDRIGQQIMSDCVTIVDNPRIPRGIRSMQTDNSGMECREITLVENGILKSHLISLRESRELGVEPMGRDLGKLMATNISILPGAQTPQQLMADINDGIYIEELGQGIVDVNNGTYSVPANGHQIKGGKVTDTAVDEFLITGSLQEIFMNVTVANDTPTLPNSQHSMAAPTTRLNGLTVAAQ